MIIFGSFDSVFYALSRNIYIARVNLTSDQIWEFLILEYDLFWSFYSSPANAWANLPNHWHSVTHCLLFWHNFIYRGGDLATGAKITILANFANMGTAKFGNADCIP